MIGFELKGAVLRACRTAVTPIARLCIKVGITQKELSELTKASFLKAAQVELRTKGEAISVAKICGMTGMSRRDVSVASEILSSSNSDTQNWLPLTYILTEWHTNHRYMGKDGRPVRLPVDSDGGPSLRELFEKMAPDSSFEKLLIALLGHKCIELRADEYALIAREIVPEGVSEQVIIHAGLSMYSLGSTIVDNLMNDGMEPRYLERMTVSSSFSDSTVPRFLTYAAKSGRNLIEVTDAWVAANESPESETGSPRMVGMGIFSFDVDDPDSA